MSMREDKLEIGPSCHLVVTSYEGVDRLDVSLDYTEHSSDHWHSDTDTSLGIDEGKAREIVAALTKAFGLDVPKPVVVPTPYKWCLSCGEGVTTFCRGDGRQCPHHLSTPNNTP